MHARNTFRRRPGALRRALLYGLTAVILAVPSAASDFTLNLGTRMGGLQDDIKTTSNTRLRVRTDKYALFFVENRHFNDGEEFGAMVWNTEAGVWQLKGGLRLGDQDTLRVSGSAQRGLKGGELSIKGAYEPREGIIKSRIVFDGTKYDMGLGVKVDDGMIGPSALVGMQMLGGTYGVWAGHKPGRYALVGTRNAEDLGMILSSTYDMDTGRNSLHVQGAMQDINLKDGPFTSGLGLMKDLTGGNNPLEGPLESYLANGRFAFELATMPTDNGRYSQGQFGGRVYQSPNGITLSLGGGWKYDERWKPIAEGLLVIPEGRLTPGRISVEVHATPDLSASVGYSVGIP